MLDSIFNGFAQRHPEIYDLYKTLTGPRAFENEGARGLFTTLFDQCR